MIISQESNSQYNNDLLVQLKSEVMISTLSCKSYSRSPTWNIILYMILRVKNDEADRFSYDVLCVTFSLSTEDLAN